MTAREYLERVERLEYKIKCMKLKSDEYERLSFSIPSPQFDAIRVDGTRNHDAPFVKWIYKKLDIDAKIKEEEKKLDNLKAEVLLKIEELDNEEYKVLLIMKYIEYKPLDEIAGKLFISLATAKRRHSAAIDAFQTLYEKLSPDEPK